MYQLEQETEETRSGDAKKRNRNCCCCMGCAGVLALLVIALLSSNFSGARALSSWMQCTNNMKQIGLAMQNYHSEYHSFPPAYTTDENGKPLHSWRVLILPYLDEQHLYSQIRLDEPWDSEYNRAFHGKMPDIFWCPSVAPEVRNEGKTSYMRIVGPGATTDGANAVTYDDVKDCMSEIIVLVEVYPTVNWMAPVDISPEQFASGIDSKKKQGVGSFHYAGLHVGMLDGSTRMIKADEIPQYMTKTTIPTDHNEKGQTQ